MRAVDTNVLVRLLMQDDTAQFRVAEEFIGKGAWVSHLVLAETMWVLATSYGRTAQQLASSVERLILQSELTLQDADVVGAALALFRGSPRVEFSDCLVLEIARKAGHLPLGTFDQRLAKIDGAQRL
jgi:predicted nucleic-acid-binding protein